MCRAILFLCAAIAASSGATSARAAPVAPFSIPIDEATSSVTVEVCIPGGCDSDVSSVSGFTTVALDDGVAAALMELHDFDYALTDTVNINISVFLGGLTAAGEDLRLFFATPGEPVGPADIVATDFEFLGVPTNSEGSVAYNASGSVCLALQAASQPCSDTRDLSEQETGSGDISGTLVIAGGVATLTVTPDIEVPLDPDTPDLGTLHVTGTITGSAPIPQPVPTTSQWGLTILALTILAAGTALIRKGRDREARF